jgi:amino acid transporter
MALKHLFHGWDLNKEEKFLKTPVGIFLLGAFLGTMSPDPTDVVHFWLQNHVLNNPSISTAMKAFLEVFDWYFLSASYFLVLLVIAYFLHIRKVSIVKRVTWIGGILSIGAVIGILAQLFLH